MHGGSWRPLVVWILMAAATILVVDCGDDWVGSHRFRTFMEDGVRVAETVGGPAFTDSLFRFEEVLRLDQDPAEELSQLNRVTSFDRGPDGRYYVLDGRDCRVVVYETDGVYRSSFGRGGGGPGEFRNPNSMFFAGDTLVVYDTALQRASRFTLDGRHLDSVRQSNGGSPYLVVPHGGLLIGVDSEGWRPANIQYGRPRALVTRASTGDTVAMVRGDFVPESRFTDLTEPGGNYRGSYSYLQMGGHPEMVVTPDYDIVVAQGDIGLIQVFSVSGEPRLRIRVVYSERPIDAAFRDRYFAAWDSAAAAWGRSLHEDVRERVAFAEKVGFSDDLLVDDRGWFWLMDPLNQLYATTPDAGWWRVVDAEGRYLGRALVPGRPHAIKDGLLMSVRYEESTGEQIPTVYRIVPMVEGIVYP